MNSRQPLKHVLVDIPIPTVEPAVKGERVSHFGKKENVLSHRKRSSKRPVKSDSRFVVSEEQLPTSAGNRLTLPSVNSVEVAATADGFSLRSLHSRNKSGLGVSVELTKSAISSSKAIIESCQLERKALQEDVKKAADMMGVLKAPKVSQNKCLYNPRNRFNIFFHPY